MSGLGAGCFEFCIFLINKYNIIFEYSNYLESYLLINLLQFNLNIGTLYSPPDASKIDLNNNLKKIAYIVTKTYFWRENICYPPLPVLLLSANMAVSTPLCLSMPMLAYFWYFYAY
jgi:hypothetical protein